MSDERIDIELTDKVNADIAIKIKGIAASAKEAHTALNELKKSLASINASGLNALKTAVAGATSAISKNALASQNLATAQAKTALAGARLQTQQAKTTIAQNQGALAAQKLATAQQQTIAATNRAALAQARLQQAHNKTALSAAGAASGIKSFLMQAAAIIGIAASITAVIGLADSYTVLQNKLKVVGESEQGVATLTNRIFDVARRSRVDVEDTASSFVRFDLALKQLGATQEESLRMTETVNKSLIVSGATTSEARNSLLQLGQAFNKGKLDGDEFRSVMEQMPLVADAIAKQLHTVRGNLLNLAPTGVITADVMRKALASIADDINKKFAKTIPTIGQSLVNLKSSFIQTFGEINKSLGVTSKIASIFQFIGNHLRELGSALAVLGVAMLAVFGPALIAMLGTATASVWAFTVALAANPIGLIAVGITAATAAIMLYGDELKISSDSTITLKDVALSAWDEMKANFGVLVTYMKIGWIEATNIISDALDKILHKSDSLSELVDIIKVLSLTAGGVVAKAMFGTNVVDAVLKGADDRAMKRKYAEILPPEDSGLRGVGPNIIPPPVDKEAVRRVDMIGKLNRALNEELKIQQRILPENVVENELLKINNDLLDKKHAKLSAIETLIFRGKLQAIQNQKSENAATVVKDSLSDELKALEAINSERKDQLRLAEIENKMLKDKNTLSAANRLFIQNQIKMESFLKAKNETFSLKEELNDKLEVLRLAKDQRTVEAELNAIIKERYTKKGLVPGPGVEAGIKGQLTDIKDQTTTNTLADMNRELAEESKLLSVIGPQREIEQRMQEYTNTLYQQGADLNDIYVKARLEGINKEIVALQHKQEVNKELENIYNETAGAQQELQYRQEALNITATALNKAYADGQVTLKGYSEGMGYLNQKIIKLGLDTANLKNQLGNGDFGTFELASIGSLIEGYQNVLTGLTDSFKDFFKTLDDGFANSIGRAIVYSDNLGESLIKVGQEAVASLISALIKLGIQWALNAALGKALSKFSTKDSITQGAAVATAWAPAAAAVSLATMGANASPAMIGMALANATSMGLAQIGRAGAAFKQGGFTGNKGLSEIAGVVHGKEFVMNAEATAANRPVLEAMNKGRSVGANLNVSIENYGTSKEFDVQHIDEGTIRIIARDEAKNAVYQHAPTAIANDMGNANSKTSKAVSRNTDSRRRR